MQAASTDNCNGRTGQHGKGVVARETKKILLLHGNRQTGPLLLGRLSRLQRRFYVDLQLQLVAPDAPFAEDECDSGGLYLTWWNRVGNHYVGLETTLELLKSPTWNSEHIVGIMGFSQGARLAHLLTLLHHQEIATKGVKNCSSFPNLRFVIMVGGYDAPLPDGHAHLFGSDSGPLSIPSLHIWGLADTLVPPEKSQALMKEYFNPRSHFHPGSHFVPTKGPDIKAYVDFIEVAMTCDYRNLIVKTSQDLTQDQASIVPDEEIATLQQDEIQALQAIFPDEIQIKSPHHTVENGVEFTFPIVYHFHLLPKEEHCSTSKWPIHPLTLEIVYPNKYPLASIPLFRLIHQNSSYEFPTSRADQILTILRQSSEMEMGMPSVLSGIYAVNEFLDAPLPAKVEANENLMIAKLLPATSKTEPAHNAISAGEIDARGLEFPIRVSSPERINLCNLEGLEIAEQILKTAVSRKSGATSSHATFKKKSCSGGTFDHYVIGLVGKPSAGKSTFFNAATAFSRQRSETAGGSTVDSEWGGASMAAHPFTTINPNIGYCLIPVPFGLCPEDALDHPTKFGATHGRSPDGRRFLPVLLKDVAGLVPGAYLGKGRGNQFLNDLTDATVLIHVVDASGTSDAQGNKTVTSNEMSELTNPLEDLAWIRKELVEWVYSNLSRKWTTISRKGRDRVSKMFSGYGQREVETQTILTALEQHLSDHYNWDNALDHLDKWDQGDVHRLVSAFLGVRFPMALALNKCDLPSSKGYIDSIQESLPIHGAHAATPMAAADEMLFVRNHLRNEQPKQPQRSERFPGHVWKCLTSALQLREPILVFPVSDMTTYASMLGLDKCAGQSASLPSPGMIRCIRVAGGSVPSCWDDALQVYVMPSKEKSGLIQLRDVLIMKEGSTVDDVFLALKKIGAISGDFVRAEATGDIGEKAKPIPKHEVMSKRNRIIKIMSNKRTSWQS